jgi:hypothetical protein
MRSYLAREFIPSLSRPPKSRLPVLVKSPLSADVPALQSQHSQFQLLLTKQQATNYARLIASPLFAQTEEEENIISTRTMSLII